SRIFSRGNKKIDTPLSSSERTNSTSALPDSQVQLSGRFTPILADLRVKSIFSSTPFFEQVLNELVLTAILGFLMLSDCLFPFQILHNRDQVETP
ncbi:MAG: hypothetical protein ACETWG_06050, partial [Candidatus Neomarinimicrobiota bacterium]